MVKENGMIMMTEQELDQMKREHATIVEDYEKRLELMQKAIMKLFHKDGTSEDVRVPKIDFLAIYDKALEEMFDNMKKPNYEELLNDIYGHDITVHWHGLYCNCGDGAVPSNYIIPAVKEMLDEDCDEY